MPQLARRDPRGDIDTNVNARSLGQRLETLCSSPATIGVIAKNSADAQPVLLQAGVNDDRRFYW
ncbi:hypothetical protein ACFL6C_12320 [Myxococcota bacterium]